MDKEISNIVNKDFYEYLCNTIKGCVELSTIDEVATCKHVVMLGSNLNVAFNKTICELYRINPQIRVILVSTQKQFERIPDDVKKIINWIEWNDKYSDKIYDELKKHDGFMDVDGLFFLGRTPVNMRDMNIYGICRLIQKDHKVMMYMCDYTDLSVYKYENLDLYYTGMELYKVMNRFIGLVNR